MSDISKPKIEKNGRTTYAVSFTVEEAKIAEDRALTHMGEHARIAGFRPGKAPLDLLREKVDKGDLLEETIRQILPKTIREIVERDSLKPIMPPKIEVTSQSPLAANITLIVRPEVSVKGIKKISIDKKEVKADPKDIDRMVDYMRNQYRTTSSVDRAAKDGDEVTMNFTGKDGEGKSIPGTDATGYKVVIGSKSLIPGFEEGLVGMKKGDVKELNLTFPAKYHAEHLQNKPGIFTVTVTDVAEVHMPELTDAFVKEHHMGETAAGFRESLEKNMMEQEQDMERRRRESALFDAVRAATSVDLAPELIEQEARAIAENLGEQLQQQKISLEQWLQSTKKTPEQLRSELQEEGKKRLMLRFGLEQALEDLEITVEDAEMQAAIAEALESMSPEERKQEEAHFATKGEHGYEDILWRKKIEKFVKQMLN